MDNTVIQDGVSVSGAAGNSELINLNPVTGGGRITNITFNGGTRPTRSNLAGIVLGGLSTSMRLDHCNFSGEFSPQLYNVTIQGSVRGVIDHCIFSNNTFNSAIQFNNGGTYGDTSWSAGSGWGTSDFMFVEDCYFNNTWDAAANAGGLDCANGGKYVCRYNIFHNAKANTHGTETGGNNRSCRAIECMTIRLTSIPSVHLVTIRPDRNYVAVAR